MNTFIFSGGVKETQGTVNFTTYKVCIVSVKIVA